MASTDNHSDRPDKTLDESVATEDAVETDAVEANSPSDAATSPAEKPTCDEPTFDELAQRVALGGAGGDYVLSLDAPEMNLRQKIIRLVMLLFIACGILITISYSAFRYYQYAHPFGSANYDGDQTYMAQQIKEAADFIPPPSPLLRLQGAELLDRKYLPSSNGVTEEETIRIKRRPDFLADHYKRRWGAIAGMKSWVIGEGEYFDVTASHKNQRLLLRASISPDQADPGYTIVSASVRRPPNYREKVGFQLPSHLPRPPKGSTESVTGGGGSDTKLGRVYQYIVPRPLNSVMDYYRAEFERDGWEMMGRQRIPGKKGGVSMVYRKNEYGVTIQGTPIRLSAGERSVIALVPF